MFDYVATQHDGTTVAVSVTRVLHPTPNISTAFLYRFDPCQVLDNALNAFSADKAEMFLKKKVDR